MILKNQQPRAAWATALTGGGDILVRRSFRRGFTFTEVMFAVILLGIGFIMLAGMFPVAIQQTQTNVEESTASTIARAAAHYMEESLTVDDVPPTGDLTLATPIYPQFLRLSERCYRGGPNSGKVISSVNPNDRTNYLLWEKLQGGFILPQDSRF